MYISEQMIATLRDAKAGKVTANDLPRSSVLRLVNKGLVRVRFGRITLTSIGEVALASYKLGTRSQEARP